MIHFNLRCAVVAMLTLIVCVAPTGCSQYRDPSVNVMGASMGNATDEALVLDFTLNLENPNDVPLRLVQFEYDVSINGERVYSGVRAAEATLATGDTRQLRIPAVVRFDEMKWIGPAPSPHTHQTPPQDVVQYAIKGRLQYITPGEIAQILLDLGVRKPRTSFKASGEVALR